MAPPEFPGARAVPFTQEDVRRLCEFLYRRTGMSFDDTKRYYIDRRLAERIAATRSESFQSYFAMLRSDAEHEIEHLINAFTVNETYFYREDHQLQMHDVASLSDLLQRKKIGSRSVSGQFRVRPAKSHIRSQFGSWKTGARSTITTSKSSASDIDSRALKSAAEGYYGTRALMRLSRRLVDRYFEPIDAATGPYRPGPAGIRAIHARKSDRFAGHGAIPRFRYRVLQECTDLFR